MKNVIIFFCLHFSLSISHAQIDFISSGQHINYLAGRSALVLDFNNDGFQDLLALNENGPEGDGHRLYLGDGTGQFNESGKIILDPYNSTSDPGIADINADGILELIVGKTVWRYDTNGSFTMDTTAFINSENDEIYKCKAADLNGDNLPDIFALVGANLQGRVYLNNGQGKFVDTGRRVGSGVQADFDLEDVNGDGNIDAIITGWRNVSTDPCPNRVWLNDGTGNYTETGQVLDEAMRHVHGLKLGDIDSDGDKDLIFAVQTSYPYARVYLNDGTGNFTKGQSCGSRGAEKVKLGDIDIDGDLDMVLACNGPNEVWLNNGSGTYTNSGLRLGSEWTWGIDLGDFNNDGKLDIFAVNMAFDNLPAAPYYIARGRFAEVWINTTPTSINEGNKNIIPNQLQLFQNYPNPFNPSTNINYEISTRCNVSLKIFDTLGREIKILSDNFKLPGKYSIIWDATDDYNNPVSSGVYFYKLETQETTLLKKMLLLR